MNGTDLTAALAERVGLTQADARACLRVLFADYGILTAEMAAGRTVAIQGFGTFGTKKRAARTGTNPRTGAAVAIRARRVPTFRAGKGLREMVEG